MSNDHHLDRRPNPGPLGGLLLVVGVLVLTALALLQTIGGVTGAMTVVGCPSATPVALQTGPGGQDAATRARAVTGWHAWERAAEGVTPAADEPGCVSVARDASEPVADTPSALAAAQRWFEVDVAFAILYGAWLVLAIVWMRRHPPDGPRATALGSPVRWLAWRAARSPVALAVPVGAALADVVENITLRGQLASWWRRLDRDGVVAAADVGSTTVAVAGATKWVLAVLAVALVGVGVAPVVWRAMRAVGRSVPAMLLPMLAAVVFAVALALPDQAADALRRMSVWQWLTTLGVLAVFMTTLATAAARSLRPTAGESDRPGPPPPPRGAVMGDIVLLAAAILLAVFAGSTGRHGVFVPAGLIGLVAVVSLVLDGARWYTAARRAAGPWATAAGALFEPKAGPPKPLGPPPGERHLVAAAIAVVPLAALGVATIGASAADAVLGIAPDLGAARRLVLGCLLVVAAAPAVVVVRRALTVFADDATLARRAGLLALLVVLHVPFAAMHVPGIALGHAHRFGSVVLAMVFVSGFVLIPSVAATLSYHAVRTRGLCLVALPTLLRVLGFRATPVLGLLVAWFVLASTVSYPGYHDVRRLDPAAVGATVGVAPPPAVPWTVGDVGEAWAQRQEPPPDDAATPATPALMVAASGGGIRAAFYTAAVLDCIIERDGPPDDPCGEPADPATVAARRRALVAMSGISGGSLGLTSYVVAVEAAAGWPAGDDLGQAINDDVETRLEPGWYRDRLGDDYLAPTIATWLFNDGLNALLRPRTGVDRGAILERSWERSWPAGELGLPFLAGQTSGRQPVLLMNGFDVDDGCRVNTSVLGSRPSGDPVDPERCRTVPPAGAPSDDRLLLATADAVAQLCPGEDLRYATAALNSARFPFVSPAGRLAPCEDADGEPGGRAVPIVDGGYRETSGASTIVELWPALAPELERAIERQTDENDEVDEVDAVDDIDDQIEAACVRPVFLQIDNGPEGAVEQRRSDRGVAQWLAPAVALGASPGGQEAAARQASRTLFGSGDAAWFRIATFAHPGSSAPLGWVLSETAQSDLERQLVLNADAIAAVRAHLDDPPAC